MDFKIITINREFASQGSEIAQDVAKKLQIPYVDKFLITESALKSGFSTDAIEATDEKLASRFAYSQAEAAYYYASNASSPLPTSAQIAEVQFDLIRELSTQGPCVIVGRCANFILKDRPDVLDVFIHAGRDIRVKNTMEQFGLSERKAVGLLRRTDRARKAYYKNYTGADWNDPNAYHLVVNSDRLEYEKCVDLICKAYQGV
jgi:hypothetical protein